VISIAVSHDKQWIVSGSKDRGVRFWDAHTGTPQCMLQGHKNTGAEFRFLMISVREPFRSTTVISVDLTPERHILATGSDDSQVQIDEPPLLATGSGDWQARICGPFYSLPLIDTNHRYCRELHQHRGCPSKTPQYQSNTQGCPSNTPAFFRRLASSSSRVSLVYRWGFSLIFILFHVT
jgi:hypothetical protein